MSYKVRMLESIDCSVTPCSASLALFHLRIYLLDYIKFFFLLPLYLPATRSVYRSELSKKDSVPLIFVKKPLQAFSRAALEFRAITL